MLTKQNYVLLVGYDPSIAGGLTTRCSLLCDNISYLKLHSALKYYRPKRKALLFLVKSLAIYFWKLIVKPPRIVQVIIGSRGDALRMLPFILLAKLRGCSLCLHFRTNHAAIFRGYPRSVRTGIIAIWSLCDVWIFLSAQLRNEFQQTGSSNALRVIIANPLSQVWFQQKTLELTKRTRDIVFLGRWMPEKGTQELVTVMREFADSHTQLQCEVYADGRPDEVLSNMQFNKWLPESEVLEVLRHAKLLVLPSHAEAYPTVLLEAAACGTPFVASRVGGVPDMVAESQAGFSHSVGETTEMRQKMEELLTNKTLWSEYSENGRRWAERHQVSKIKVPWLQLYGQLGIETTSLQAVSEHS